MEAGIALACRSWNWRLRERSENRGSLREIGLWSQKGSFGLFWAHLHDFDECFAFLAAQLGSFGLTPLILTNVSSNSLNFNAP